MHNRMSNAIVLLAAYALSTGASAVFAHEGHGLTGAHTHATDAWGFIVVGALSALAVWVSRKGK